MNDRYVIDTDHVFAGIFGVGQDAQCIGADALAVVSKLACQSYSIEGDLHTSEIELMVQCVCLDDIGNAYGGRRGIIDGNIVGVTLSGAE